MNLLGLTLSTVLAIGTIAQSTMAMPMFKPPVDTRVLSYTIIPISSKVSKNHATNLVGGSAEINYAGKSVMLKLEVAPVCKKGTACAQNLMLKTIELPIVSSDVDNCNVVTVTAKEDKRMVDGALQIIKIEDYTNASCEYFVAPTPKATYTTQFLNKIKHKSQTDKSVIDLQFDGVSNVGPADAVYTLTGGKYLSGVSNVTPDTGSLTISENTVKLEVTNRSNCPMGAMCTMELTGLEVELPILSREKSACAEVITAQTPPNQQIGSGYQTMKITDYNSNACDINPEHPIVVEYSSSSGSVAPQYNHPVKAVLYFSNILVN